MNSHIASHPQNSLLLKTITRFADVLWSPNAKKTHTDCLHVFIAIQADYQNNIFKKKSPHCVLTQQFSEQGGSPQS